MFQKKSKKFSPKRKKRRMIDPDNIFLDSKNLPQFDEDQFEGRLEKTITKKTVASVGIFFVLVLGIYLFKISNLQITQGAKFLEKSENNHLQHSIIFPERGIIYDKNGLELVSNSSQKEEEQDFFKREYLNYQGLSHILGYVTYPKKDKNGNYFQDKYDGKSGVEKFFNEKLSGKKGLKIVEKNALLETESESIIQPSEKGESIHLSVDVGVQQALYNFIYQLMEEKGFQGGAGAIMDVNNGEILALVSCPEYDAKLMSNGGDRNEILNYITSGDTPFLNRATTGLYAPGSIVKPFLAVSALNENIITPQKQILSTGSIAIPNPYFPEKETVFTDWKAHGWVDMTDAIAVSSDVYFYEIGGGYEDQIGLGIEKINQYMQAFGFGEETGIEGFVEEKGVIPNPQWKAEVFDGEDWRIGDTYHTAIGQYGFLVTPLQAVRATVAIANGGKLLRPTVVKKDGDDVSYELIDFNESYFQVAREGMRQAVTDGTGKGLQLSFIDVSAKTGTAEVGLTKAKVNSWVIGFFPTEKPRYAFTVIMEKGPEENQIGGLYVMRQLLEWMQINTPEYLK